MNWNKISLALAVLFCAAPAEAALINTYEGGSNEGVFGFYNGTPTPSITATASSAPFPASNGPNATVNGNGFWPVASEGPSFVYSAPNGPTFRDSEPDGNLPEHSNGQGSYVSDDIIPVNQQWIAYNLDEGYFLDSMKVWNYYPPQHNRGLQDVYIWYSLADNPSISASAGGASPGPDWIQLGSSVFTFANTTDTGLIWDDAFSIDFGGVALRHVLLDVESNYGDTRIGLSEVQFFGTELPPPAPEPSTALLACLGGLMALASQGRKKKQAALQ